VEMTTAFLLFSPDLKNPTPTASYRSKTNHTSSCHQFYDRNVSRYKARSYQYTRYNMQISWGW